MAQTHGIIHRIEDTIKVSDNFQKRQFILTVDADKPYPQYIPFELQQTSCDIIDAYQVGQDVSVDYNLKGREWNGPQGIKYFLTLQAWKIQPVNK